MTTRVATVGPAARRDLDDLRKEAGAETASRFAQAAIRTFGKLANKPNLGPSVPTINRDLAGTRKWRIGGFPEYLIFYRPSINGVEIVRVLHAGAGWRSLLDAD